MWFLHNPGLLGINARNLLYIKAYNPEKAIMMADSKIMTKNFLSVRGIPVAKLYGMIQHPKELETFDWNSLPDTFVIKPNAGYGGEGIMIIVGRKAEGFEQGRKEGEWIRGNGEKWSQKDMERYILDILDGRYSLLNMADIAFFEQRLEAPEPFSKMAFKGLPDIRVVVHNLIPVMSMLRLPTEASDGKANLHMGGIAAGIDLAKGELTHVIQYNKEIDSIPGYGPVKGLKIPYWEEILLIASRVQQYTNLGFAAVDITLDKSGPVLLEINARAGLSVQIANMAPLRRRLERIQGIKVSSPEKGVRIAQDIFGQKIERTEKKKESQKAVIGNLERVEIIGKKGNLKIVAHPDAAREKSVLDETVAREIGLNEGYCKFAIAGQRVQTVVETADLSRQDFKMLIGLRDLKGFLIDPFKRLILRKTGLKKESSHAPQTLHSYTGEEWRELDAEVVRIDQEIHLLSHLKPLNLQAEYNQFLVNPAHNPQFEYKPLSFDPVNLRARLQRLEFPDFPLGVLLQKKADEIERKIALLEARGTEDFTSKSIALYGAPSPEMVREAYEVIKKMPSVFPESEKKIDARTAQKIFEQTIADYDLKGWSVKIKENMVSDAIAGKENTVMLREGAVFTDERLKGTIAHEIETHIFTAVNGSLQPYKIFQRGLADYLATEEGLAVYNQKKTESGIAEHQYWSASSVVGIDQALRGSFSAVYALLVRLGFSAERAWKVALKAKRGLADTGKPGAFTKDIVYTRGYQMILDFVRRGGDIKDLYYGKINLQDLDLIKKIKGLKTPLYLPLWLKTKEV